MSAIATLKPKTHAMALDRRLVKLIKAAQAKLPPAKPVGFVSHPLLSALRDCGTAHIYADTADREELHDLAVHTEDDDGVKLYTEIDGNTTNQPLIMKVLGRFFGGGDGDNIVSWTRALLEEKPDLTVDEAAALIYSIINGRLGLEALNAYAAHRTWRISLELHTALAKDPEASRRAGWCLAQAVPNCFVKVAFTPDYPHSLLIARGLERQGIAVNFTATFSARQVVAAALLADVHRANIFLGRLNQGMDSELLGEHTTLKTQRHIRRIRNTLGVKTLNMAASVRRWQTIPLTAGCDVYTVPYPALKEFFAQSDMGPGDIKNRLDADYSDRLGVSDRVLEKLGGEKLAMEKIERLYRVEPEFVEFLTELRQSAEVTDGDNLFKRFDEAGFGDFFYAPTESEWRELRKGKLPDLDSPLTQKLPLDTLYSLLAVGDFINFQDGMDEAIKAPIRHLFARGLDNE
ncbi:MAG: transaldolase family protein [Deltaproteobacteria bacterium]